MSTMKILCYAFSQCYIILVLYFFFFHLHRSILLLPIAFRNHFILFFNIYLFFIYISWRLITLKYCSGFCHTLTWISHGFTCVPHPDPPSCLPPPSHPSGSSQCTSCERLSHASNLDWRSVSHLIIYMFQCYSLRSSPPCFSHRVQKSVLYICVSFSVLHIGLLLPSF